jgi:hypothetical protein
MDSPTDKKKMPEPKKVDTIDRDFHKELIKSALAATFPATPFPSAEAVQLYATNLVGVTEVIAAKYRDKVHPA